ncbi:hypothetical protein KEJ32_02400 [Candidatus Bathyarchaeota archaeon]|nr:hypothetical protein [Candidatus Bathyarchaeota archaeon]
MTRLETLQDCYIVKAVSDEEGVTPSAEGFPPHWLIIILAIFTVLASTTYYVRKRKRGATASNYSPQQVSCSHLSHVKAASIINYGAKEFRTS